MDQEIKEMLDNGVPPEEVAIIMRVNLDDIIEIFQEMYT
jgi:hypothetical protein